MQQQGEWPASVLCAAARYIGRWLCLCQVRAHLAVCVATATVLLCNCSAAGVAGVVHKCKCCFAGSAGVCLGPACACTCKPTGTCRLLLHERVMRIANLNPE
jgi:hypothetical protein